MDTRITIRDGGPYGPDSASPQPSPCYVTAVWSTSLPSAGGVKGSAVSCGAASYGLSSSGVTDLDHFRLRRRDAVGGVIHEYRLVAYVFGTHNPTGSAACEPARVT